MKCDNSVIYWDTVETCFGNRELSPTAPLPGWPTHKNRDENMDLNWTTECTALQAYTLSGCVEPSFTPDNSLDSNQRAQLARILNVVAYNAPDAPYLPLIHPVAGLLLEAGLNEEEVDHFKAS